jgi:hypothetical protein
MGVLFYVKAQLLSYRGRDWGCLTINLRRCVQAEKLSSEGRFSLQTMWVDPRRELRQSGRGILWCWMLAGCDNLECSSSTLLLSEVSSLDSTFLSGHGGRRTIEAHRDVTRCVKRFFTCSRIAGAWQEMHRGEIEMRFSGKKHVEMWKSFPYRVRRRRPPYTLLLQRAETRTSRCQSSAGEAVRVDDMHHNLDRLKELSVLSPYSQSASFHLCSVNLSLSQPFNFFRDRQISAFISLMSLLCTGRWREGGKRAWCHILIVYEYQQCSLLIQEKRIQPPFTALSMCVSHSVTITFLSWDLSWPFIEAADRFTISLNLCASIYQPP